MWCRRMIYSQEREKREFGKRHPHSRVTRKEERGGDVIIGGGNLEK